MDAYFAQIPASGSGALAWEWRSIRGAEGQPFSPCIIQAAFEEIHEAPVRTTPNTMNEKIRG